MLIQDFEKELQQIHPDFSIVVSPNSKGLAGVHFRGVFQFGVPDSAIFEDPSPVYGIELPTGSYMRHRSAKEARAMAKNLIELMKNNSDEFDAAMGQGEYSPEKLK